MSEYVYNDINDPSSGTPADRAALEALASDALEHWRDEAVKAHPGAARLREYLTANSKAEVIALAAELEEKLGGSEPSTPDPTRVGGSPALGPGYSSEADEVAATTAEYRRSPTTRNFSELLRARYHAAGMPYVDEQ